MAPLIGITSCRKLADYVESVRRAGGEPRVLEIGSDTDEHLAAGVDGLILTGGADVDPALYGQAPHATFERAEEGRDEHESALVRTAIEHDLPVLAICRGVQVMNVARGGTLIQDIPSQVPGAVHHLVETPPYAIAHEVWITANTRLMSLMREAGFKDVTMRRLSGGIATFYRGVRA